MTFATLYLPCVSLCHFFLSPVHVCSHVYTQPPLFLQYKLLSLVLCTSPSLLCCLPFGSFLPPCLGIGCMPLLGPEILPWWWEVIARLNQPWSHPSPVRSMVVGIGLILAPSSTFSVVIPQSRSSQAVSLQLMYLWVFAFQALYRILCGSFLVCHFVEQWSVLREIISWTEKSAHGFISA